jgi:chromosome segregation ATPase
MEMMITFKEVVLPMLLTGGIGYLIIQRYLDRKRTSAEVKKIEVESGSTVVDDAIKVESHIYDRYIEASNRCEEYKERLSKEEDKYRSLKDKLAEVQAILDGVAEELAEKEVELQGQKKYIMVLEDYICSHGLGLPNVYPD